jgi:hypothetical protein
VLVRAEDVGGDGGGAEWSTVGVSQGARREAGWYIDVERMEEGDPKPAPSAAVRVPKVAPSRTLDPHGSKYLLHMCAHCTEITAARLIHCIVRVNT